MVELSQRPSIRLQAAAPSQAAAPKRVGNGWLMAMTAGATLVVGYTLGLFPLVGGFINHGIERISNHIKARRELDARAEWYRPQIAKTLGISPDKVRGKHLEQAAEINPDLAAAVRDVKREESKENKTSAVVNTAISIIPGATAVKETVGAAKLIATAAHTAKVIGATTAGGLLVDWASKDHISAQEVIEGISGQLAAAEAQGRDPKTVITPQMTFLLHVAKDEKLAAEIEQNFKKPFQKMNEAEQNWVMQQYAPLANAAASEAHAVANRILPVQELMARAPNLNGTARYVIGNKAATFAGRISAERVVRAQAAGFAATERERQAMMPTEAGVV